MSGSLHPFFTSEYKERIENKTPLNCSVEFGRFMWTGL